MILDKKKHEDEIFKIRQKVYSKLNQGRNVYSSMRMFKWKVEKYLRTFRAKLSYDEEKKWRKKVVITEKAVVKIRNERKATINATRAQELLIENLPDPPKDDEVEETLRKLKRLDEENETFDDKNEVVVEKEIELKATKVKIVNDKITDVKADENVDAEGNGVEKLKKEKDVFDMKSEATEHENKNCKNESKEGEALYELKNLYDKIVPESVFDDDVMGMHDDMKYMQVPSGTVKEDEEDRRMDVSTIVSFLLIIFAMVLVHGKTLHEQPLLINRLSQLSQSSLLSQLQPEELLSLTSSCSCQAESGVCCKVTTALTSKVFSMASKVSTCVTWCRQIWVAVYAVEERLTASITTVMPDTVARMESTACAVIAWLKRTSKALCVVTELVIAAVSASVYQGLVQGAFDEERK